MKRCTLLFGSFLIAACSTSQPVDQPDFVHATQPNPQQEIQELTREVRLLDQAWNASRVPAPVSLNGHQPTDLQRQIDAAMQQLQTRTAVLRDSGAFDSPSLLAQLQEQVERPLARMQQLRAGALPCR